MVLVILKRLCMLIGAAVILVLCVGFVYKVAQDNSGNRQCVNMGYSGGSATGRGVMCVNEIELIYNDSAK